MSADRNSSASLAFLPGLVGATSVAMTASPPGDFDDPKVQTAHLATASLVSNFAQLRLASSSLISASSPPGVVGVVP